MKHKNTNDTIENKTPDHDFATRLPEKPVSVFTDGDVLWSYSRAEAMADGVLIDVSKLASECGIRYPVALTAAAWHDCVVVAPTDFVHDETGRLWDVLNVLRYFIRMNPDKSEVHFCVDVADENEHVTRVWLKCLCGPGDDPAPVLTVMLPEED